MPLYVRLVNLTEKGLRDFKDTVARAEAFRDLAKKHGATVKEFFWTDGGYDMVTIIEAPNGSAERPLSPLDKALALFADPAHQHEDRDNRKASRKTNPYADAAERGPEA
jgi:GYD domain-containing protein